MHKGHILQAIYALSVIKNRTHRHPQNRHTMSRIRKRRRCNKRRGAPYKYIIAKGVALKAAAARRRRAQRRSGLRRTARSQTPIHAIGRARALRLAPRRNQIYIQCARWMRRRRPFQPMGAKWRICANTMATRRRRGHTRCAREWGGPSAKEYATGKHFIIHGVRWCCCCWQYVLKWRWSYSFKWVLFGARFCDAKWLMNEVFWVQMSSGIWCKFGVEDVLFI